MTDDELIVPDAPEASPRDRARSRSSDLGEAWMGKEDIKPLEGIVKQWTTSDGLSFFPSHRTELELPPGLYDIKLDPNARPYFAKLAIKTEALLTFPHTNSATIAEEVAKFWYNDSLFKRFGLAHKRGILLYGPPGSGKSSTIQIVIADVISRGGVALKWGNAPVLISMGMAILRSIQPETPVVIFMEDLDSIIEHQSESEVLNILDGVEAVHKVVFLASTNYPEKLGARIVNRPSRFDKRFKIGHPTPESRLIYFKHLLGDYDLGLPEASLAAELAQWVSDTEGFSLAHLRELFIAVVIMNDSYPAVIKRLSGMKEKLSSGGQGTISFMEGAS